MKRLLTLLLACTALVAAGCGGDDEESSAPAGGGNASTQEDSGSGSGASSSSGEVAIAMKNFQFVPKAATVKVGQTVKWTNEDSAPHDVVDEKTSAFKSKLFNNGETYEFTAKKAGKIEYVCTIHPGMVGTLTVTE
jgi:plastocyanin